MLFQLMYLFFVVGPGPLASLSMRITRSQQIWQSQFPGSEVKSKKVLLDAIISILVFCID